MASRISSCSQHLHGHRMHVGERLRADFDPHQLHQFRIRMDDARHPVGDGGRVRGEKARVEALDAARRRDRTCDQVERGGIRQEARIAERLPASLELRLHVVRRLAEAKPGFLAGFADRGIGERARARCRNLRAALHQPSFKRGRDRRGHLDLVVLRIDAAAGKHERARHEHDVVVPLADQHLRLRLRPVDQDQRRCILRTERRGAWWCLPDNFPDWAVSNSARPSRTFAPQVFFFSQTRFERIGGTVLIESVHPEGPLQADNGSFDRLEQCQRHAQGEGEPYRKMHEIGRCEILFDRQHQRHDDVADDDDHEIGGQIIGAVMMQILAADRAASLVFR